MPSGRLKNAPLVEAIVELRWELEDNAAPGLGYSMLLGRLSELMREAYPENEATPSAAAPVAMAAEMHMVQHRFRAAKGGWPLVQVGPTVFTVNETEAYDWEGDFRQRAVDAIGLLFKAIEKPNSIRVKSLILRYIDGIQYDWEKGSLLEFLKQDLKTEIGLSKSLFRETGVEVPPASLDFRCAFRCASPRGLAHLRFASGQAHGTNALVMETMVQSLAPDLPELPTGFQAWLDAAHEIPSTWFKRLTTGRLYDGFSRS
ncbi:MAG: TIGR04255 family protein [Planctomycetes bacterium]|nr:TIGR04255 family protein [Planctomycetota bacterium]